VLWCEEQHIYDQLYRDLVAEFQPRTLSECFWVKDLLDTEWEIERLRTLAKVALDVEMENTFAQYAKDGRLPNSNNVQEYKRVFRRAAQGLDRDQSIVLGILNDLDITLDAMTCVTYTAALPTISAISSRLARLEQRRDDLIRRYEERRRMQLAMSNSKALQWQSNKFIEAEAAVSLPSNGAGQ
jgi:hypothetical protein